ncbi:MAG: glycosyltransferase family 2 protein, partial [Candidatus Methylomirabilis sp.]|nr:glycosyltransferase family 2 protein [Deltaproteobacteria bacterium]
NEEAVIERTLRDAAESLARRSADWEILVVDNASTDGTVAVVERVAAELPGVRLIRHPRNLGYAASTRTALKNFQGDFLFIIDSDGQHTVDDVPAMLARLREGADIVWGWKRERRDESLRLWVSAAMNFLARALLASRLHDVNCGFRGFTRGAAEKIEIRHMVNSVGPEIWVRARNLGLRVEEVPVRHFPRVGGQSVHAAWRLPIAMGRLFAYLMRLRRELRP